MMNLFGILTVFAEGTEVAAEPSMMEAITSMIVPLVLMVGVFYFLLIRPQRKRDKEAKAMMESLQVGDKVVSIGGIYGKITKIKDDTIVVETGSPSEKSYIKLSRSAVKEVLTIKE